MKRTHTLNVSSSFAVKQVDKLLDLVDREIKRVSKEGSSWDTTGSAARIRDLTQSVLNLVRSVNEGHAS